MRPTVQTGVMVQYSGVYRCTKCNTAEHMLEQPYDMAPICQNCKVPVIWLYLRELQRFAW